MALEKVFKIPSLVRKAGQAASKAQPFYSPIDEAIANITQGKGTGAQMLAELMKTKGVAKELKDRPAIKKALEANKDTKVTKADVERVAAESPAAQIEQSIPRLAFDENNPSLPSDNSMVVRKNPDYPNNSHFPIGVYDRATGKLIGGGHNDIDAIYDAFSGYPERWGDGATSDFSKWTVPGGENYREVLIKLPPKSSQNYQSSHFNAPNVLAHARVTDRIGPNGEKILHVEEIQSDWHQAGRKKGYALPAEERIKLDAKRAELEALGQNATQEQKKEWADIMNRLQPDSQANKVPDAPFKQNWHELVMKRLLDDAARNGYDKVVITPGAKQAERYDLSKQISRVVYSPTIETLNAFDNSGKSVLMKSGITPERVEDYIGKEPAKRLLDPQNTKSYLRGGKEDSYHEITGEDLRVGGEGMKGFYDQILPSYLNDYGKRYGARVGTYNLPDPEVHHIPTLADIERGGMEMFGRADLTPEETLQVENAFKAQRSAETAIPLHSFDITPQMREEITTKGQPLYQVAPPVAIGAGAAMQEEEPSEYAGGGIIKKAGQIIGKAAQSSGMAPPVTATKNLTTLQDFHTSLGDRVRERVGEKQNLIESMPFKYDKGQRVFTEDSARKNRLPYEILDRTLYGNQPMRADHPVLGPGMGAVIKDPDTGKSMRTPYEAGYRVRSEGPEGWQEYVLPETAIKGDVEMAGGGAVRKALKAVLPKGQQAILPAAESAANLERFLSKSQIENPVFHVAKTDVKQFSPQYRTELSSMGHHFGTSDQANFRSGQYDFNSQSPNIGKYHLSIQNPLEVSHMASFAPDHLADTMMELNLLKPEKYDALVGKHDYNPLKVGDDLVKILKKNGYDGLKYPNEREGEGFSYVPFDATQIKSAIGNRGTYDPAEADITKAKGGQVSKDAMWIALQNKQLRKKHGN